MRSGFRSVVFLALSAALPAQTPGRFHVGSLDFNAIQRPPVPSDPLELVTSTAQPTEDAQARIAALGLLNTARALSNVRAQPYDLKTSFTASGGSASDGNWTLEDVSRGHAYRWTAQGPNYSAINLYPNSVQNGLYGSLTGGVVPLRLLQARAAIFFNYPSVGQYASVRTATGFLNGAEQHCVLVAIGAGTHAYSGPRNWEESEYCVDAQSGVLTEYSPVPGLYVRYDYSAAIQFHGKSIPNGFTISQGGQTVVDAKTISVTDPPAAIDPVFSANGLPVLGTGRAMNPGVNIPMVMPAPGQPFPQSTANAAIQVVTLHGNYSDSGLGEVEVLASTDPSFNQAATDFAKTMRRASPQGQPGTTPQTSELIYTLEFVTATQ
jgi:hypothetical protein